MNSSQILDLIVLGILLFCAVRGAARGLMSQLAWAVALLLCFKFSGTLSPAIEPLIPVEPPLKQWVAMLVIYVGLCGAAFVAAGVVEGWLEKINLIEFDRHLGGLLGLVKGIIFCMTVMYFLITISPAMREIVGKTWSGYGAAIILSHSQFLLKLVPEHSVSDVQHVIERFNQNLQPVTDELAGAKPASPQDFHSGSDQSWLESDSGFDLGSLVRGSTEPTKTPARKNSTTSPDNPSENTPTLSDILEQLPAQLRDDLTKRAVEALDKTTPEQKQKLLGDLQDAVPENLEGVLVGFLRSATTSPNKKTSTQNEDSEQGRPASVTPAEISSADTALLSEIAGIYNQRSDIVSRSRDYLTGVPPAVIRRVLEDWHADAMGLNRDPDPGTDVNTLLDDRILRQLNRAGISLDQLDRTLRTRLSRL
ncbi:MAG: CvpA family protein [Planctomycetia bacterium]